MCSICNVPQVRNTANITHLATPSNSHTHTHPHPHTQTKPHTHTHTHPHTTPSLTYSHARLECSTDVNRVNKQASSVDSQEEAHVGARRLEACLSRKRSKLIVRGPHADILAAHTHAHTAVFVEGARAWALGASHADVAKHRPTLVPDPQIPQRGAARRLPISSKRDPAQHVRRHQPLPPQRLAGAMG